MSENGSRFQDKETFPNSTPLHSLAGYLIRLKLFLFLAFSSSISFVRSLP